MAAVHACLILGHHPYVTVGDPNLPEGSPTENQQVVDWDKKASVCKCVDKHGSITHCIEDWLLAFSCDFCATVTVNE
jgi:hypothetical protein